MANEDLTFALVETVRKRVLEHQDTVEDLLLAVGDDLDEALYAKARALRELGKLAMRLSSLLATSSPDQVRKALGAPGDFGYQNPVGAAMFAFYKDLAT